MRELCERTGWNWRLVGLAGDKCTTLYVDKYWQQCALVYNMIKQTTGKKINSHYQESARKWEKQANTQNYIKKHFGIHQIVFRFFFSLTVLS